MTEQEKQVQLQLLKAQHIKNTNTIDKAKGEARKLRMDEIVAATDAYCVEKRAKIAEIDSVRMEKKQYDFDDPHRNELIEQARMLEDHLGLMKTEHEADLHKINARFAAAMLELDDKQREENSWYEDQKAFIMSQKAEPKQEEE